MKYKQISAAVLLTALILSACDSATSGVVGLTPATLDQPPYVITKPVFEITARPLYFNYAAIVFNLLNTSAKEIDRITAAFTLYDPVTLDSPFIGSNMFELTRLDHVLSNQNKEIIISLDQYIYIAPDTPYLIDLFYLSEIHYTDGSVWQDKNGIYRIEG